MSEHSFKIQVDTRESRAHVADFLQKYAEVDITYQHLPIADYAVNDMFLFERKTLPDLIASIKDGRVFKQACCLAAAPQRGVFILEGSSACLRGSNMNRAAIQGLLIKISVFLNIPVLRAKDAEESARLILYTVRQSQKLMGSTNHTRHFSHKRPQAKQKTQQYILQGIPGIGPARAGALLNHFASVEAIFSASAKELSVVSGINQKTAGTICWAVKEPDIKLEYP
ncbi:MAG: nuclease [Gammaproteobacteria bacterium]|nr:MAG: nuclease [Gammaproteobacteria bacterium]